ncbi:uncharacterized protein LOC128558537 [Mercenaria mercenaria]|uniref:uncharacterized protein LOC128558537 n=1 Tax=Mercenaria mercenaria TaxID=6596 RepID=UPI00234EF0E8|nr:uncharacterized protein LOC128558537 [Mercenaria mercenaria]
MSTLQPVLLFLFLHVLVADDISHLHNEGSIEYDKYSRAVNNLDLETDIGIIERSRRQASTAADEEYYVTQCGYDNVQQPDGPSVQVLGVSLQFPGATLVAAKLLHLLVRFMPRTLYLKIVEKNTVGIFPTIQLPANLFTDFTDNMPSICGGRCGIQRQGSEEVDCDQWCTTPDYPYQSLKYSINYLWAYGNFSRLFVVETNVICLGFNPSGSENLL